MPEKEVKRSINGKYLEGTCGGPGNPFIQYQQKFRGELTRCFKPLHFRKLAKRIYADAMTGNSAAQKLLWITLLGKEVQQLDIQGLLPIKLYNSELPLP